MEKQNKALVQRAVKIIKDFEGVFGRTMSEIIHKQCCL